MPEVEQFLCLGGGISKAVKDRPQAPREGFENIQSVIPCTALVDDDIEPEFGGEFQLRFESLGLRGLVSAIDDYRFRIARHFRLKCTERGGGRELLGGESVIIHARLADGDNFRVCGQLAKRCKPVSAFLTHIGRVQSHDGINGFVFLCERHRPTTALDARSDANDASDPSQPRRLDHGREIILKIRIVEVGVGVDEHGEHAGAIRRGDSSSGVEFFDHGSEAAFFHMGINLRGRDVRVTEKLLDDAEIGSAAEEVRRKAVTHEVGIDIDNQSGTSRVFFYELLDALGREFASANGKEDLRSAPPRHESRPLFLQIQSNSVPRRRTHWHEASFVSLAGDANEASIEFDIFQSRGTQLRNPEATRIKKFKHRAVAKPKRILGLHALQELEHIRGIHGFRQVFFRTRQSECLSRIFLPLVSRGQEAKKDADRDGFEPHRGRHEPRAFTKNQKVGDLLRFDRAPILGRRVFLYPITKPLQRTLDGKLVVRRQPPLGGEIHQELLDFRCHGLPLCVMERIHVFTSSNANSGFSKPPAFIAIQKKSSIT